MFGSLSGRGATTMISIGLLDLFFHYASFDCATLNGAKFCVNMSSELIKNFSAFANRVTNFIVPLWLIYFYVIALSLAYVIVRVHAPLTLYPGAPHDDGLFMSLGRSLAEGHWLGPYNQFTLMKGPGYPAFLAVANWLGISVSLAHALFYCAAAVFFVAIVHRFIKSHLISGLLLALLLGQLLPTTVYLDRILREQIAGSQLLFLFAVGCWCAFSTPVRKNGGYCLPRSPDFFSDGSGLRERKQSGFFLVQWS